MCARDPYVTPIGLGCPVLCVCCHRQGDCLSHCIRGVAEAVAQCPVSVCTKPQHPRFPRVCRLTACVTSSPARAGSGEGAGGRDCKLVTGVMQHGEHVGHSQSPESRWGDLIHGRQEVALQFQDVCRLLEMEREDRSAQHTQPSVWAALRTAT